MFVRFCHPNSWNLYSNVIFYFCPFFFTRLSFVSIPRWPSPYFSLRFNSSCLSNLSFYFSDIYKFSKFLWWFFGFILDDLLTLLYNITFTICNITSMVYSESFNPFIYFPWIIFIEGRLLVVNWKIIIPLVSVLTVNC